MHDPLLLSSRARVRMAQDHVFPASAPEGVGGQKLADAADNLSQEGAHPQQRCVYICIYIYVCTGNNTCACDPCQNQCIDCMAVNITRPAHTCINTTRRRTHTASCFFFGLGAPLSLAHPVLADLQVGCGELPSSGKGGPCASGVFSAFGSSAPIRLGSRSSTPSPCSRSSSFLACLGACGAAFSCRPPSSGQALSASAPSF